MSLVSNDDDQIVIDENKSYLTDLVGEGKKFKDPESLARGKWHADKTIELMEKRMDDLRTEYQKEREQNLTRAQLEEVISKFASQPLASNVNPTVNEDKTPMLDPNQLESLVATNYQKIRDQERQESNYKLVQEKAQQRFGSNYKQQLAEQMNDLGMSAAEVENMAKTNPKVFIKTFGLDAPQPSQNFQAPPRSANMPLGHQTRSGNHMTWSQYQAMKKDDPKTYFNQKTQNKMMDDYAALGEKFEDGDFHQEY